MSKKKVVKEGSDNSCNTVALAIQDTLYVVGGKWKLPLISILRKRKMRFRELSREAGISPRILSKELHELGQNGLVSRTVLQTKPVSVEYAVTPYCETLGEVIGALRKWGMQHRKKIIGSDKK